MKINELQEGVEYYMTYEGIKSTNKYRIKGRFLEVESACKTWVKSGMSYNSLLNTEFEPCEWTPKIGGLVYYPNPWSPTAIDSDIYNGNELHLRLMGRLGFYRTAEEAIAKAKELGWT